MVLDGGVRFVSSRQVPLLQLRHVCNYFHSSCGWWSLRGLYHTILAARLMNHGAPADIACAYLVARSDEFRFDEEKRNDETRPLLVVQVGPKDGQYGTGRLRLAVDAGATDCFFRILCWNRAATAEVHNYYTLDYTPRNDMFEGLTNRSFFESGVAHVP